MSNLNDRKKVGECRDVLSLYRGTLTDNGATPWYTVLMVGSERQKLKFAIDTGTTHSWVTSIQCTTDACLNHQRFDFRSSMSFVQITDPYGPVDISFGPWGMMKVTLGSDLIRFVDPTAGNTRAVQEIPDYQMYIAQNYSGQQFLDLIWDGAIGVPTKQPKAVDSSESFSILMKKKSYFPFDHRALCFNYAEGVLEFLDIDMDSNVDDLVTAPVVDSCVLPGAWVVNLSSVDVDGVNIKRNLSFCLDTGSSRFKGDPDIIEPIIKAITRDGNLPTYIAQERPNFSAYPNMVLTLKGASICVTPEQYFEQLAKDYYKLGFHDMAGLDGMLLAGSTFLEPHSPIFFFDDELKGTGIGLVLTDS